MTNIDAHQIAPKLWIGSQPSAAVCRHFDVVVLCAYELQDIPLNCPVLRVPLDDARPTPLDTRLAMQGALTVHQLRKQGKRVLVTCAQGVNRSSLVAALALMLDGMSAADSVNLIRNQRKPPIGMLPLSNRHFVQLLQQVEQQKVA